MTHYWRSYFHGAVTVYLLTALMIGVSFSRQMPALNLLGATYSGLTWPLAMFCTATRLNYSPMPPSGSPLANAFFTFS